MTNNIIPQKPKFMYPSPKKFIDMLEKVYPNRSATRCPLPTGLLAHIERGIKKKSLQVVDAPS